LAGHLESGSTIEELLATALPGFERVLKETLKNLKEAPAATTRSGFTNY
jgi:hypothetical protein